MSSIGVFSFAEMIGEKLQPNSGRVAVIERPGRDGQLFRIEPNKAQPFEKRTVELYTAGANANAAAAAYAALKTQLVTVVDETGLTTSYVMVLEVRQVTVRPLLVSSLSGANYAVTATWTLHPTV